MRTITALLATLLSSGAALAEEPAAPTSHADQQLCLTWLALAAQWGPEAEREAYNKDLIALNQAIDAPTDPVDATRDAEAKAALDVFNNWLYDHGTATPEVKQSMESELMPKAIACKGMIPSGEEDEVISVPADGEVGGAAGTI